MENNEKTYILADWQDLSDNHEVTLTEGKEFLINLLEDELDEDDPYLDEIEKADSDRLDNMLGVCDYALFTTNEDYQEAILTDARKVWVKVKTSTGKGCYESFQKEFYSVLDIPIFVSIRFDSESVIVYKNKEGKFLAYEEYRKSIRKEEKIVLMYLDNNKIIKNEKIVNELFDESIVLEIVKKFKELQKIQ